MVEGHGDDIYKYANIRMNFSSNIYSHADTSELENHLITLLPTIHSYPEPAQKTLEGMIADLMDILPTQVMVTSGATDAIWLIAQTFRNLLSYKVFNPTFSEYEDASLTFGLKESDDAAICWLCNPNNPTGEVVDKERVEWLAKNHKLLVVDQSYEDYTLMPVLSVKDALKYGNVIQIRSMTKRYGIPGLRVGFITAPESIIDYLRTQYRPWAVNALAIEAGKWLVNKNVMIVKDLHIYLAEALRLNRELNNIHGVKAMQTKTNFMLCTICGHTAYELKEFLAEKKGMLIRDASNFKGLTPHHFRISTQSKDENDDLIDAIKDFMLS